MIQHREKLDGVDPELAKVIQAVALDFAVLVGKRGKVEQDLAFATGKSKEPWPKSKHNVEPGIRDYSWAVDLAPLPIDWNNTRMFYVLAGAVQQEARRQGVKIRWGGDWSRNGVGDKKDDQFLDLGHFELDKS